VRQITSFKNKTSEDRAIAVLRPSLIPIFPNDTAAASRRRIQLQTGSRLKRDSWIQTANSYHVPMDLLVRYDRRYSLQHFKLTPSSITYIRAVLALPSMLRDPETNVPPVQRTLLHQPVSEPSTSSNSSKIQADRQDRLICALSHQTEESQPLLPSGIRRGQYGTYVSFYPNAFERDHQSIVEEQRHVDQPVVAPWWRRKNLDEESFLSPFTQRVQSHRRARSWLPSKETVTRILVVTIVLAVSGGVAYGGFRLLKFLYVIMAQGYHGLAVVTVKGLAAVRGAWHQCVNLVRGIGQMVVKVEGGIDKAVARVVGAVKALLGRV
jgi:hypothetical protein